MYIVCVCALPKYIVCVYYKSTLCLCVLPKFIVCVCTTKVHCVCALLMYVVCVCALPTYIGCTPSNTFHISYSNLLGVTVTSFSLFPWHFVWCLVRIRHSLHSFLYLVTFIILMPCARETIASKARLVLAFMSLIKVL